MIEPKPVFDREAFLALSGRDARRDFRQDHRADVRAWKGGLANALLGVTPATPATPAAPVTPAPQVPTPYAPPPMPMNPLNMVGSSYAIPGMTMPTSSFGLPTY